MHSTHRYLLSYHYYLINHLIMRQPYPLLGIKTSTQTCALVWGTFHLQADTLSTEPNWLSQNPFLIWKCTDLVGRKIYFFKESLTTKTLNEMLWSCRFVHENSCPQTGQGAGPQGTCLWLRVKLVKLVTWSWEDCPSMVRPLLRWKPEKWGLQHGSLPCQASSIPHHTQALVGGVFF